MQHYLQQAPEDENIFYTLPHAEWESTYQGTQQGMYAFEQQFRDNSSFVQDPAARHGNTSAPATPRHHDGTHRRRQTRQARHLRGVGSQFQAEGAPPPTLAQDQRMMADLRHLAQYPVQDVAPQGYEETTSAQAQEMTDRSYLGVGSQFQQEGQSSRY